MDFSRDKNKITIPISRYEAFIRDSEKLDYLSEVLKVYDKNLCSLSLENEKLKAITDNDLDSRRIRMAQQLDFILNEGEFVIDKSEEVTNKFFTKEPEDELDSTIEYIRESNTIFNMEDYGYKYVANIIGINENKGKCYNCFCDMKVIDKYTETILVYSEGKLCVQDNSYVKTKCPICGEIYEEGFNKSTSAQNPLNDKRIDPSLLAHVLSEKFSGGRSFFTQELMCDKEDVCLRTATMVEWFNETCEKYIEPLYQKIIASFNLADVISVGETELSIISTNEDEPTNNKIRVYAAKRPKSAAVCYMINTSDAGSNISDHFKKFRGTVISDRPENFQKSIRGVKVAGSWATVAARFISAYRNLHPSLRTKSVLKKAIELCNKLYSIEEHISILDAELKMNVRSRYSAPLVDKLIDCAIEYESRKFLPEADTCTSEAMKYTIQNEIALRQFLNNGKIPIDDRISKKYLADFMHGKNLKWAIVNTPSGVKNSLMMLSVIATARENGLEPFRYLWYFFSNTGRIKDGKIPEKLTPWHAPQECRADPLAGKSTSGK